MAAQDVSLTLSEMMLGASAGVQRQVENIKLQRKPAYGAKVTRDWQLNIEGALGEQALSKYLGRYWAGKGTFRAPDVDDMDCRTAPFHYRDLILHPDDPDDRIFWLVTGMNGRYKVQGWIRAGDGKKQEYWKDPTGEERHAFFVPQAALNDPETFGS